MITSNEINQPILQFITTNFSAPPAQTGINMTTSLINGGVIDSLAILEVILFLEDHFGISVSDDDLVLENFETVLSMSKFVHSKIAVNSTGNS